VQSAKLLGVIIHSEYL